MKYSPYQVLYDIDRILRYHGVLYWLTRSTLLSAVKVGGLYEDDRDVDICIEEKYGTKLSSIDWEKYGYHLTKTGKNFKISPTKLKKLPGKDYSCCPYVDVHVMKERDGIFYPYYGDKDFFKRDEVFPLRKIAMPSFLVFSPKDPTDYILRTFGKHPKTMYMNMSMDENTKISRKVCLNSFDREEKGTSPLNKFVNRVFVINLHDQTHRMDGMRERLKTHGIGYTHFDAIDGRCKTKIECKRKREALETEYNVSIPSYIDLPPASLTLGTWLILKLAVKNKWNRICIFEDDATFVDNFNERFSQGVKELEKVYPNWDLLYLGCTQLCGSRGISWKKTEEIKYTTSIKKYVEDANFYVSHPEDVRVPCNPEKCTPYSENLSKAHYPGGTFGYIISKSGIRKMYNLINGHIDDHIDGITRDNIQNGTLKAVSFDPPVINHLGGADRPDSNIEWDWDINYD